MSQKHKISQQNEEELQEFLSTSFKDFKREDSATISIKLTTEFGFTEKGAEILIAAGLRNEDQILGIDDKLFDSLEEKDQETVEKYQEYAFARDKALQRLRR